MVTNNWLWQRTSIVSFLTSDQKKREDAATTKTCSQLACAFCNWVTGNNSATSRVWCMSMCILYVGYMKSNQRCSLDPKKNHCLPFPHNIHACLTLKNYLLKNLKDGTGTVCIFWSLIVFSHTHTHCSAFRFATYLCLDNCNGLTLVLHFLL